MTPVRNIAQLIITGHRNSGYETGLLETECQHGRCWKEGGEYEKKVRYEGILAGLTSRLLLTPAYQVYVKYTSGSLFPCFPVPPLF